MQICLGKKKIGPKYPTFVIAEAGVNHNGSLRIAKKLITKAKNCGADAIKFQTFKADDLSTKESKYYKILKNLELNYDYFAELSDFAKSSEILFLSTPFSLEAIDLLNKINVVAFKIASGDLTHLPLIKYAAKKRKPMLISTGMANIEEVKEAITTIKSVKNNKIIILHSVSGYPYPLSEANLLTLNTLRKNFNYPVGFSDNGNKTLVPLVAVSMGANVIEKHFTLDKKMKGPDHRISSDPSEMKELIQKIRLIEEIRGDGIKKCQKSEFLVKINARRSLTALQSIEKNKKINESMIGIQRPGTGIAPKYLQKVLGKKAKRNLKEGRILKWNDFK